MAKNDNFYIICSLYFQVPHQQYYECYHYIADIFSFNLICIMSRLNNK